MSSKDTTLPGTEEAYHQFVSLCPQDAKMEGTVDSQTDVEAQLLRLTQDATETMVMISKDQLANFLACMIRLRGQVTALSAGTKHLNKKLTSVTESLKSIEQHHGCIEFHLFPKLPLELRCIIWQLALLRPSVLVLLYDELQDPTDGYGGAPIWGHTTTSMQPKIRYVCRESRDEALKVECPYMEIDRHLPLIFCHEVIDTFLFIASGAEDDLHHYNLLDDLVQRRNIEPYICITKFACRYVFSSELISDDHAVFATAMKALSYIRSKELVFVVGSEEACRDPNLILALPTGTPRGMLSIEDVEEHRLAMELNASHDLSWEELEHYQLSRIRKFANQINQCRQERIDMGLDPDFDGASGQYIQDPSDWAIEKVTYMEATTAAALKDAENTRV